MAPLRPAYGSGEDWNYKWNPRGVYIEELRPAYGSSEDWNVDCKMTAANMEWAAGVAPGLRVGRGLELGEHGCARDAVPVASGLQVGQGLEHRYS